EPRLLGASGLSQSLLRKYGRGSPTRWVLHVPSSSRLAVSVFHSWLGLRPRLLPGGGPGGGRSPLPLILDAERPPVLGQGDGAHDPAAVLRDDGGDGADAVLAHGGFVVLQDGLATLARLVVGEEATAVDLGHRAHDGDDLIRSADVDPFREEGGVEPEVQGLEGRVALE